MRTPPGGSTIARLRSCVGAVFDTIAFSRSAALNCSGWFGRYDSSPNAVAPSVGFRVAGEFPFGRVPLQFAAVPVGEVAKMANCNRSGADFDVATSATPDEVEAIFPRSIAVGKAFGVIRVGYDTHRDELDDLAHSGKRWIAELEASERSRTRCR